MYDGNSQLLVANPIKRYLINSPMLPTLTKNADGSLTPVSTEKLARSRQTKQQCAGRSNLHGIAPVRARATARDSSWVIPPVLRRD